MWQSTRNICILYAYKRNENVCKIVLHIFNVTVWFIQWLESIYIIDKLSYNLYIWDLGCVNNPDNIVGYTEKFCMSLLEQIKFTRNFELRVIQFCVNMVY